MNDKFAVLAALCDGLGQRAAARIVGVNRGTIAAVALKAGRGCAALHDRRMVGVRTSRIECDELWSFIGRKQARVKRNDPDAAVAGDAYTFVALSSTTRAIVAYHTGKRTSENTDLFIQDLRGRVLGAPKISTDGLHYYRPAIRDTFVGRAAHGVVRTTYSVTHLAVKEAARRYSPAQVIAVEYDVANGVPADISTSLVERSHLTLRQSCKLVLAPRPWLLKADRATRSRHGAVRDALQFRAPSRVAAHHAGRRARRC